VQRYSCCSSSLLRPRANAHRRSLRDAGCASRLVGCAMLPAHLQRFARRITFPGGERPPLSCSTFESEYFVYLG